MTPNARKKHLGAMMICLTRNGLLQDRFQNWKYPGYEDFRIKFKANNVRAEQKGSDGRWFGLWSRTWSSYSLDEFEKYLVAKVKSIIGTTLKEAVVTVGVPFAPGLETEEAQKKASDLLEKRTQMDYQCYMMLRSGVDSGFIFKDPTPDGSPDHNEWFEEVTKLLRDRVEVNDQLIRTVAGR